jgi:predicted outer membrane repeat protein
MHATRARGPHLTIGALLLVMLTASPALGVTWIVTNLNDAGPGSLRSAILSANNGPAPDTIVFAPGLMGTIQLSSTLFISSTITIEGPGAEALNIRGNGTFPVFVISAFPTDAVTITNVTISGGNGVGAGGGFVAFSNLTLENVVVKENTGTDGGAILFANPGAEGTVKDSAFLNNHATNEGGAFWGNSANVTILNSTFTGNTAPLGGAIYFEGAGTMTVTNSTLSGNTATAGDGGAIFTLGELTLINDTITGNKASSSGGGIFDGGSSTTLKNNIVAGNTAGIGVDYDIGGAPSTSQNNNLIGINSGSVVAQLGDIFGTLAVPIDPKLGPLADNGGPTFTHALQDGSPAINAGGPGGPTTDQRGKPTGEDPDIGSYQRQVLLSILPPPQTLEDGPLELPFSLGDIGIGNPAFAATSSNATLFPGIVVTGSAGNHTLTLTPGANQFGTATITLTATQNGDTAVKTFDITVIAVNDPPSFLKGPDITVSPGGVQTFANWATAITSGPANESGQAVTFAIVGNTNPSLFTIGPAVSPTGTLTFTAAGPGVATVTLVLQDNGGTANGGLDLSASQSFSISVTPTLGGISPTLLPPAYLGVPFSQTFSVTGGSGNDVLALEGQVPPGLAFRNNRLEGTPTQLGSDAVQIRATINGSPVSVDLAFQVNHAPAIVAGHDTANIFSRITVPPAGAPIDVRHTAFDPAFRGGVHVAAGDINGDGTPDTIVGAGPGGAPLVKIFDASGTEVRSFFAYEPEFRGGVFVAAGDLNSDGLSDIIAAAGPGRGSRVRVFNGSDQRVLHDFFAYPGFQGGVRVAAGDVNGDGVDDIVTGAGPGGGPHVKAFSGADGSLLQSFFAYTPQFAGGVYVAAGDINGDGAADIVTGAGAGGGPHVRAFNGRNTQDLSGFFAFDAGFAGGVRVAAGDLDGDGRAEIIAGEGPGGSGQVKIFDGSSGVLRQNLTSDSGEPGVFLGARPAWRRVNVDVPRARDIVGRNFTIHGWAAQSGTSTGAGYNVVHVWAFPIGGGSPVFLGFGLPGDPRPDVARFFGGQYDRAGFHVDVANAPPGHYYVVAFVQSSLSGIFNDRFILELQIQ